ncbi:MAG: hypothetical protein ACOX1Q_09685 [Eubacteriales bacterium]
MPLGHIHGRTEPQKVGRDDICPIADVPEGRGFDETGSKGVYLVNFDEGTKVTFLPLDGAKYLDLSVDLSACRSPKKAVLQAMPADIQNSLLRVTLTGEIEPDRLSIEDIEESLSSLAFHCKFNRSYQTTCERLGRMR